MNKFKHILCFASFLALSLLVLLQSCKSDQDYLIDQFIDIADSVDVEYGQTFNILSLKTTDDVTVVPASIANLSYNIEDADLIARDNYSGEFKAVGIGTTTIRIYHNNYELVKQINITVRSPFEFADIPGNALNLKYGETFNIFKPNEQSKYNISSLYTFGTSNNSVATVGYQGDIRAVGLGSATITVKYKTGNQEKAKQINVTVGSPLEFADIPGNALNLKYGETFNIFKPNEQNQYNISSLYSFTTTNNSVATVGYQGDIRAVGLGSATITVKYKTGNQETAKQINVTVGSPFEFADIPGNALTLKYGETFNIFKPNEQSKYNISSLYTFSTSDYSVATVGYQGDIRAVGLGSATITVKYKTGNQETAKQINVNVIPTLSLSLEMKSGESIDLAKLLPSGQVSSRYTSNNTQTAEVNGSIVYARKAGAATLQSNTTGSLQIITVTVTEGSLKDLFKPLSWLSGYFVYAPDIEACMKNYTCTANEERTINGNKYHVLQYKPFDNAISITFYCLKDFYTISRDKLDYAIIETGKSSKDVLGWLYNNYSFTTYGNIQPQYFNLGGGYLAIYPENNSWSTLRIK